MRCWTWKKFVAPGVSEDAYIALPLKMKGTSGSLFDPIIITQLSIPGIPGLRPFGSWLYGGLGS
jgi:hypothetical protein